MPLTAIYERLAGCIDMVADLRAAAARAGLKGFWSRRLEYLLREPEIRTYSVAGAYVRLGERDRALEWLEKLFAQRGAWMRGLKVQAQWDPLRGDPRFRDLLRRANVTPARLPVATENPLAR